CLPVDTDISTQADGAQSSRVLVPLLEDPYKAIRNAYLVGTDTESEPSEDLETKSPKSPHTVASPTLLPDSTPPACHVEESEDSDTSSARSTSSDSIAPLSPDHPLTHAIPVLVLSISRTALWKRYRGTPEPILDTDSGEDADEDGGYESLDEDGEGHDLDVEGHELEDESHGLDDEGHRVESDRLGLEEEVAPEGQQWAASVVETATSEPLRLRYGALRRRGLAVEEDQIHSTFEVGQGSGSIPEPERPKRVSTRRQLTLTTWMDPEDGRTYIDIPTYPPPTPHVQTPPSPEWSSGSLLISQHLLSSGAVRDEIFSQRYRLRSLEHEQERTTMTFGALWRPVLALEAWAGCVDTRMESMSWAGDDDHRLVHDLLVQQAALQRELQEMRGRVIALEQERDRWEQ
ncbi:hypothetical protein Tco_0471979, partial [Tanacetum coccineum]